MSQNNRVGHPKSSFSTEITKNYQIWQNKPCWTLGSNQILGSSWRVLGEREPLDFRGKHYSPCWQWHEDSSPCSWCSLLKLGADTNLFSVLCYAFWAALMVPQGSSAAPGLSGLHPMAVAPFWDGQLHALPKPVPARDCWKGMWQSVRTPKEKKLERRIEGRNNIWKDHCIHKEKQSMHVHDWCLLRD